ncbi:MAG: aminoacetone oxidase family FAD-binding enzyme [Patescibacteria group bacterium]
MHIAIIGGGAAGMMAAATIAENNPKAKISLIERNDSLGKKVIISGGGRCNVTTGIEDIKIVLEKYPRGSKFLNSAMHRFPPALVKNWFEEHGVPLKCEDDMRVFPVSNQGKDIVKVFEKILAKSKNQILFKHSVTKIEKKDKQFIIHFKEQKALSADKVILTLGGQAYRQTGSTGDGYTLAESLGHHISNLAPSLSSLVTKETWPSAVSGLSFVNSQFKAQGEKKYEFSGPFVFTHWGISGPAVFALSSLIAFEKFSAEKPLKIYLDLLPDLSLDKVLEKIKNFTLSEPKKIFKYAIHQAIPLSLASVALKQLAISEKKKNSEISKAELQRVSSWLKNLPLTIVNRRAGDEFVTAGGVSLTEVNPSTMQSKVCPNLYFAGEILDIDGYTGGFNLQAAWATGRLAGMASSVK